MDNNLIRKYVWLIEQVRAQQPVTFDEIVQAWERSSIADGELLYKRKFHKWLDGIDKVFGIRIINRRRCGYGYVIDNEDKLGRNGVMQWLLDTTSVANLITANSTLHDRILVEPMPSGRDYLAIIIEAMRDNVQLELTYKNFWRDNAHTFIVEPYCLKAFKQRWYLVAHSMRNDCIRIYGLDRILGINKLSHTFALPHDFNAEEYFADCFGILRDEDYDVETVRLRVNAGQAPYLRSLPLHPTQREVERDDDASIFELRVRPTLDFEQEILRHTPDVEVLAPRWFRNEISHKIMLLHNKYHSAKD